MTSETQKTINQATVTITYYHHHSEEESIKVTLSHRCDCGHTFQVGQEKI